MNQELDEDEDVKRIFCAKDLRGSSLSWKIIPKMESWRRWRMAVKGRDPAIK